MIHMEDYEREHLKDLVYLQEEKELFYQSLNDPGKILIEAFMSDKQYVFDIEAIEQLHKTAKLNECIPASIIVKAEKRLLGNYERNIKSLSFRRNS